jgi:CheY-like chemotaxis protein
MGIEFNYLFNSESPAGLLRDTNILYIDEDYVNYLYFSELFSDSCINFHRVCTPAEAIHYLKGHNEISLILIASIYAQKSNYSIIKLIKYLFPAIPVITILERKDQRTEQTCIEAGSDLYLSRFIDKLNLFEALSELLIPNPINV